MLRIREEQLAALGARALARFRHAALRHVRGLGAPRFRQVPDSDVARWIDARLDRRRIVGVIDDETIVLRWLEICAVHGDDVDDDDHLLCTLARPDHVERWAVTRRLLDAHFAAPTHDHGDAARPSP